MSDAATIRVCLSLALVVSIAAAVRAQRPSADSSSVPVGAGVYKLELKRIPEIKHGTAAIVEGVVGKTGQKLALADLSVLQPVEVTLFTPDESDDVRIELSKFISDQPARSGSTKGEGVASFKLRTQGDLQIKLVSADSPALYRLVVWAGDEVKAPMPSPFVAMDEHQQPAAAMAGSAAGVTTSGGGTGTPLALWLIGGALTVIAALLGVMILKRGRS